MKILNVNDYFDTAEPNYKGIDGKLYIEKDQIIKIFNTTDKETIENKIKKLEILNSTNLLCKPITLIKKNNDIIGYTEKSIYTYTTLCSVIMDFSKHEKIRQLIKIKDKLEMLHKFGIIVGDLSVKNILINKYGEILFSGLDNCMVNGLPFDTLSEVEKTYCSRVRDIDEKMDDYMLNILTMSYIERIPQEYILYYLKINNLPFILNNKTNRETTRNMIYLSEENKDNIELYVDHAKILRK